MYSASFSLIAECFTKTAFCDEVFYPETLRMKPPAPYSNNKAIYATSGARHGHC